MAVVRLPVIAMPSEESAFEALITMCRLQTRRLHDWQVAMLSVPQSAQGSGTSEFSHGSEMQ
jgi:hypothetical protein